jgi:hypothetical protein
VFVVCLLIVFMGLLFLLIVFMGLLFIQVELCDLVHLYAMQLLGESPFSVQVPILHPLLRVHVGVVPYMMFLPRRLHVGDAIFLRLLFLLLIIMTASLDLLRWWRRQAIFLLLRVYPKKVTYVGGMKLGLASIL